MSKFNSVVVKGLTYNIIYFSMIPRFFPPPPAFPPVDTPNPIPKALTPKKDFWKALKDFGPVKKPPVTEEFRQRRYQLNNMSFFEIDNNPMYDFVYNWKLDVKMLKVNDNSDSKLCIVNSKEKLIKMCEHLQSQSEIAIDAEFDVTSFYHDSVVLIQISTNEYDFVIDPLIVFAEIKDQLGPIFLNPNIVKIVFSENDVRAFQRDYGVWFCGVIDYQNLRKNMSGSQNNEGLASIIYKDLNITLDKQYQIYPWIKRPLPLNVLEYARNDTKFLLKSWNVFKPKMNSLSVNYANSITLCTKRYSFPKIKNNVSKDFENMLMRLSNKFENKDLDKLKNSYERFKNLCVWRDNSARIIDVRPYTFVNNEQLGYIIKLEHSSTEDIFNLYKWSNKWPIQVIYKLLDIFNAESLNVNMDIDWEDDSVESMDIQCSTDLKLSISSSPNEKVNSTQNDLILTADDPMDNLTTKRRV